MKNMNAVPLYEGIYSSAQNATFCVLENFYSFTPLKAQNIYMSHLTFASEIIAKSYIFAYPLASPINIRPNPSFHLIAVPSHSPITGVSLN